MNTLAPVVVCQGRRLIDDFASDIDLDREGGTGKGTSGGSQFKTMPVLTLTAPVTFQRKEGAIVEANKTADQVFDVIVRVDFGGRLWHPAYRGRDDWWRR